MIETALKILEQYGIAGGTVIITYMVLIWIIINERRDRRAAWKANNELMKENNNVLRGLELVLVKIAERVK